MTPKNIRLSAKATRRVFVAKPVTNILTVAFADVFSYILEFEKYCTIKQPEISEVKSKLLMILEVSAAYILAESVDPRDYDDARFAVCAWVDEVILHMPWIHRGS